MAALVEMSAALAGGSGELRSALERAAEEAAGTEVEEAILQAYLFVGFPTVLRAMSVWREVAGEPPGPEGDPLADPGELSGWGERGEALCRRVYGRAYDRLRRNVRRLHPALDRWMVLEGYGKVLGRPGLEAPVRELCIVALLVVGGREPQLHSHLRGALNVGATPEEVEAAVAIGLGRVGNRGDRTRVERLWGRVRSDATGRGSSDRT